VARVRAEVERLSARQRLMWGLRFDEGWTVPEVAAALELSPETVKTQLGRALRRVQERLEVARV
jgi:RNA polymerase sigma factor (sigma-70 family)